MSKFSKPGFHLQRVYSDGSTEDPKVYKLKDINGDWNMGRRGFLITTAIGIGMLSGNASCTSKQNESKSVEKQSESNPVEKSVGVCAEEIQAHTNIVEALSFSPNGKVLASGSDDKTIKLWEMPSRKLLKRLEGDKEWVLDLTFSPNGKFLGSGSLDNTIKLWEIPSCKLLKTLALEGHKQEVHAFSLSPDGQLLASGSADNTIKLWEMPSGKLLRTLEGQGIVNTISFSPDGKLLASGDWDTIKLWEIPSGKFLTCLFDPAALEEGKKANQYTTKDQYGHVITNTLPCGSPIPPGAICTCNCVPGTYSVAPPSRPGGFYCTCDKICTCIPIK
jgi:WD40 repeat protein